MKYSFIVRATKTEKGDLLNLLPSTGYVYFLCVGLKDLRNTIRHITPLGYRVRTSDWFSKYLKLWNYDLVLESGFLTKREMYRIIKVEHSGSFVTVDYENKYGKTYPLKVFTCEEEIEKIKTLFN